MGNAKRARPDTWSPSQPPTPIGKCTLKRESMFELPTGVGRVSTIAAWSPKSSDPSIAVGTEAGAVIHVTNTGSSTVLEATGPAILCLTMKSASWSKSQVPDIISGDCEGRVTVFSMNQVFSRSTLSAPISAIALNSNPNSANSLVIGDLNGVVTACHAQETLWRTQIRPYVSSALIPSNLTLLNDTAITAICASQISDKHGMPTSYVLAATGSNQINILARSFSVMAIPTTAIVNSMCTGLFIQSSAMSASQVMVGDESGQLFVLDKFELIPYASVPHPVTRILAVPLSAFSDKPGPDVVVCQTRSDSVYVIYNRQIVYTLELGFWPVASDIILSEPSSDSPKVGVVVAENRLEDDGGSTVGALHMYSLDVAM